MLTHSTYSHLHICHLEKQLEQVFKFLFPFTDFNFIRSKSRSTLEENKTHKIIESQIWKGPI